LAGARILVDPGVGEAEALDAGGVEAQFLCRLEDGGAEAADGAVVLEGDDRDAALEQARSRRVSIGLAKRAS